MTEREWLTSEDPLALLGWCEEVVAPHGPHGQTTDACHPRLAISGRKEWLIGCAVEREWLRRNRWPRELHEGSWRMLEKAECTVEERKVSDTDAHMRMTSTLTPVGTIASPPALNAVILRDLIGNPFRRMIWPNCERCGGDYRMRWIDDAEGGLCSGCVQGRQWLTPAVLALAQAAYEERDGRGRLDHVRLTVLADALEEAGCTLQDLLDHLRGKERCLDCHHDLQGEFSVGSGNAWCPRCGGVQDAPFGDGWAPLQGSHFRGCWALDVVLGKD